MTSTAAHAVEHHVLAVLSGRPVKEVAEQVSMHPADLSDAVETYRSAGRAALQARTPGWYQVRVRFTDWVSAEQVATAHVLPAMEQAEENSTLAAWWFLRKYPCWRLRCLPGPDAAPGDVAKAVGRLLDGLTATGAVTRWSESVYEPEALAFGGSMGMDIAHGLFHTDSRGVLTHLRSADSVGRKEISVLLCATMCRSARQDVHEHGDVWDRVAQLRPLSEEPSRKRLHGMASGLRRLMRLDTAPASPLFASDGPLPQAAPWAAAFATAGRRLADADRDGALKRGLRATLANHVIFHWNRIGLPASTQAVLARAARDALMFAPSDESADPTER